jgi:hypothetical protein
MFLKSQGLERDFSATEPERDRPPSSLLPRRERDSAQQPSSERDEAAITERLEKEADEMAGAAEKVEKRYDQNHDIFTK